MIATYALMFLPLVILRTGFSAVTLPGSQVEWQTIDSRPFNFYYLETDQMYIRAVADLFQIAYAELANKLTLKIRRPVDVFLCPTQDIFNQLTGNFIPDWGEGVADPIRSVIILKSPSLADNQNRLPKLVRHEMTHILIGQAVANPQILPKWFNEGMAIYCSADEAFTAGEAISKALISDSIIPLDEIDEVLQFHRAKAQLAYEESFSFTLYLIEQYGLGRIVRLIQASSSGKSFDQLFEEVFGLDIFDVELEWYDHIAKKYRWRFLLNFETYLWIFILLLFILVFVAIRLRNRRVMKKWEEEDHYASS